jgi:hypothetical protein
MTNEDKIKYWITLSDEDFLNVLSCWNNQKNYSNG